MVTEIRSDFNVLVDVCCDCVEQFKKLKIACEDCHVLKLKKIANKKELNAAQRALELLEEK